jgi:hypothetical protein
LPLPLSPQITTETEANRLKEQLEKYLFGEENSSSEKAQTAQTPAPMSDNAKIQLKEVIDLIEELSRGEEEDFSIPMQDDSLLVDYESEEEQQLELKSGTATLKGKKQKPRMFNTHSQLDGPPIRSCVLDDEPRRQPNWRWNKW